MIFNNVNDLPIVKVNLYIIIFVLFYVGLHYYLLLQDNHMVSYPQSAEMALLSPYHYLVLGHCADQTHTQKYAKSAQGEQCMAVVDWDRCLLAKSRGYSVFLAKLVPQTCSPKNNLLVGIPHKLKSWFLFTINVY